MRILILLRGYDSLKDHRVGNFELDQAKALTLAGHDVRAVAVDTRSPLHLRPVGCYEYTAEGIPVTYCSYPCGRVLPALQDALSVRALRRALDRLFRSGWQPDIVHAHFLDKGFLYCSVPASREIPFLITEHSSAVNRPDVPERLRRRMRLVYGKAARVLAVGSRLGEYIRLYTGVEAQIVPNMLDTAVFTPIARRPRGETFRFVSAGNFYRIKGFDVLLEAMALLVQKRDDAFLTVIGDGEEENALKRQADRLELGKHVRFAGRLTRPQMAAEYENADAFVLASRGETFGVAFIEAMAAGLPVIATRCGGPEDFVDESRGILVPAEDPAALAEAMERMIRTADSYDAAAISAFARENYSPQAVAGQLTEIYKEILGC